MTQPDDNTRPDQSGSTDGSQHIGQLVGEVLAAGELQEGFSESLRELALGNPRAFGSHGQTTMLVSIVMNLERTTDKLRSERDIAQREARDARELSIQLNADLRNEKQGKSIRVLCVSAGVALLSQCKTIYDLNPGIGILAGCIGIALFIAGIVPTPHKD